MGSSNKVNDVEMLNSIFDRKENIRLNMIKLEERLVRDNFISEKRESSDFASRGSSYLAYLSSRDDKLRNLSKRYDVLYRGFRKLSCDSMKIRYSLIFDSEKFYEKPLRI